MADDNKEVKAVVSEITSVGTDEGQKAPDVKTKRKKSESKRASKTTGKEKPPSDDEGEADEADKAPKAGDDKEKEAAKEGGSAEGEAAKEEGKEGGEEAKGEDQEKKEGAGKEEEEAAKEVVEEAVAEAATGAPAAGEEGGEQEGGDDMEVDTTYDLIPIRTVGAARAREDGQDEGADEGTEPESPEDEELRALLATDPKTLRPQRLFDYWRRLLELQYGDQVAGRFDDPTEEVGEFEEVPEEIVKEVVEKAPSAVEVRKSRSRSSALAARVSRTALAARQQSRSSLSARPSATATSKQSLRGTRLSEAHEPRASESAAGGRASMSAQGARASLSAQGARSSTGAGGPRGSEARPSTTEGRPSTTDSPRGSQAKEGRKSRGSKRASKG